MGLAQLIRVVGKPIQIEIEDHVEETRIDHVWIDIEAGDEQGFFRIALNTWSRGSFASGFDPRIRVARVSSTWTDLPTIGIFPSEGLDYSAIETGNNDFQPVERTALEQLLIEKFESAILIEVWGELYERGHRGLHQVHSRRASAVVRTDYVGRDGAVCFYHENTETEMLLFKFFGQS